MARARNIKPGFFLNTELAEIPPIGRLAFIGMWTIADYKGCIECNFKKMKAQVLPYDDCDLEEITNYLEQYGFIRYYSVQGKRYIKIHNFELHQNPHKNEREAGSKIPDIDEEDEKQPNNNNLKEAGTSTEQVRNQDGTARADSLLLIPDSLNSMSGKPDLVPHKGINGFKPQAVEVLNFLNIKTGRNYQPVDANLKLIAARLKEGASVSDCRAVVAKKAREWGTDERMAEYLRPATLFNATKFAQYRGELVEADDDRVS